jgi:hypothetical protein
MDALYSPEPAKEFRIWIIIGLIGLYLFGLFFWGMFFSFGKIPLNFHDWAEVNAARIAFVKDALQKGVLPLHMQETAHLHNMTDRYFAMPDVISSPQLPLLLFLDVGQYVYADVLILYTISTISLLLLRKKLRLSIISFAVLFLLFNFNGYIQAHYGVGHITWGGYFLFPAFFLLVFKLLDGEGGWRWTAKIAFLLFYIVLLGSEHHFVWLLLFLFVLGLVRWDLFKWIALAGLFAGLLSAVRLLPPTLYLREFSAEITFRGGYPSLESILMVMALLQSAIPSSMTNLPLGYWELDLYVGIVGTLFILYYGVYLWGKALFDSHRYFDLVIPTISLFILSIGKIFEILRATSIPLISGERVSSRMIAVPFVLLLILGSLFFQEWLNNNAKSKNVAFRVLGLILLGIIVWDLWRHNRIWRPESLIAVLGTQPLDLSIKTVGNHPDPIYFMVLLAGLAITLTTTCLLLFLALREVNECKKGL